MLFLNVVTSSSLSFRCAKRWISSSFCWEKSWILSWSVSKSRHPFGSKSKFSPWSRTTQTPNPFLDDDECNVGQSQDFWLHYSLISCSRLTDIFISKIYNVEPDLWHKWISQNVNWESVDRLKWRDVSVWKWSRRTENNVISDCG